MTDFLTGYRSNKKIARESLTEICAFINGKNKTAFRDGAAELQRKLRTLAKQHIVQVKRIIALQKILYKLQYGFLCSKSSVNELLESARELSNPDTIEDIKKLMLRSGSWAASIDCLGGRYLEVFKNQERLLVESVLLVREIDRRVAEKIKIVMR